MADGVRCGLTPWMDVQGVGTTAKSARPKTSGEVVLKSRRNGQLSADAFLAFEPSASLTSCSRE